MSDNSAIKEIAKKLVSPGKGIWAADASPATLDKRLLDVGITPSEKIRTDFREMLVKTEGIDSFISGVILHDETIRHKFGRGEYFRDLVSKRGLVLGIKVDKGTKDMANFQGEKVTEGIDGLRERLTEYKTFGAKFAKWRAVFSIGKETPSSVCITSNADLLGRYAALTQEVGMVPIVEPEVLMEGDHNIDKSEEITTSVLKRVFEKLADHKVLFEGMLLKPNVVHPGKDSGLHVANKEVAQRTLRVLKSTVPPDVVGVVFLSGGDAADEMTSHIDLMNEMGPHPWEISFSFERAMEGPAMEVWKGNTENVEAAQRIFYERARLNSLARSGEY